MGIEEGGLAIRAHGLARHFGARRAVDGLDLEVARGELFGLVGSDGAGKSTTIRLLCGILQPTGGETAVLGRDLRREARAIKARIGYLAQNFTQYGDLTVEENLVFFAEIHGVTGHATRREELLEFTRLGPFRARLAQALSGGMKKKLALACTLMHRPELLFLDEPSTGVDPVSRGELWGILSQLVREGVTIFMTTPYLDEAERCHRLCLMHRGRALLTGTPSAVRGALPGRVERVRCPRLAAAYQRLRERWPAVRLVLLGESIRLWSAAGEAGGETAARWLEAEGFGPVDVESVQPTLEDAFIGLLSQEEGHRGATGPGAGHGPDH